MIGPDYIDGPIWEHRKRLEVRLAGLREFRGTTFFDIRIWHDQGDGNLIPGKGATIPLEGMESLHRSIGDWLQQRSQTGGLRAVE